MKSFLYLCAILVWNPLNSFKSGSSPRWSSIFIRNVVVMRRDFSFVSGVSDNVLTVSSTRSKISGAGSSPDKSSSVIFATTIALVILSRLSLKGFCEQFCSTSVRIVLFGLIYRLKVQVFNVSILPANLELGFRAPFAITFIFP